MAHASLSVFVSVVQTERVPTSKMTKAALRPQVSSPARQRPVIGGKVHSIRSSSLDLALVPTILWGLALEQSMERVDFVRRKPVNERAGSVQRSWIPFDV